MIFDVETSEKAGAFCTAAFGLATCTGGAGVAALGAVTVALTLPSIMEHVKSLWKPDDIKLIGGVSKTAAKKLKALGKTSEYTKTEMNAAKSALGDILEKLPCDAARFMELNRDNEKFSDWLVGQAGELSPVEYGRKNPDPQAAINRKILKEILLAALDALKDAPEIEARLQPYYQGENLRRLSEMANSLGRIEDGVGGLHEKADVHETKLDEMLANQTAIMEIFKQSPEGANAIAAGVADEAIFGLIRGLGELVNNPQRAFDELIGEVRRLIDLLEKARIGSNLDANIDLVYKEVARYSNQGKYREAARMANMAIEESKARRERQLLEDIKYLEIGIEADALNQDPTGAANKLLFKTTLEHPDPETRFEQLRTLLKEWYQRGSTTNRTLDLRISTELAQLIIAEASTDEQKGTALNDHAITLSTLGERAGGEAGLRYLEQAVAGYDAALEIRQRDTMPFDWAMTQVNRATALSSLGDRAGGEAGHQYLEKAVAGYDKALEINRRDTMPVDWARTQMNRANALSRFGARAGGDAGLDFLQQAVVGYDAVLEINQRDTMPVDWATTQMNRAGALCALGERTGGEVGLRYLEQAVAGYDAVREIVRRDTMPTQWATMQSNRANALCTLGERARGEAGLRYMEQVVAGYDATLEIVQRDTMPFQWATTQMNRAIALRILGDHAEGKVGLRYLEQAVAGYDVALEIIQRDTMSAQWALTQMNRAIALTSLGKRNSGEAGLHYLEQAVAGGDAALEVYDAPGMEYYAEMARRGREIALAALERLRGGGEPG